MRPQLDRLAKYPGMRGLRMQLQWHKNPQYRFAAAPDLAREPMLQHNIAHLADYEWSFDLQVFSGQMKGARELAASAPKVTFILQHAGMLEELSAEGYARWRSGMRLLAACPNVVSKLSGLGTFIHRNDPAHIAAMVRDTMDIFGLARCLFGSNFPIEKLWTGYGDLLAAYRRALDPLGEEIARAALMTPLQEFAPIGSADFWELWPGWEEGMALEIKIFGITAILNSNSSFLVLGRDCGRTRRVPTLGFLVLGGTWPVLVDTGYRSNQIMETLGMRGMQSYENMIENQLKKHGLRLTDVRYVLHTHLHIDHAGKDDLFPMNTTAVINRRELEYSVSGLMHPQYPAVDIKHLIDRLHTKGALRFLDLELSGPTELMPGLCAKRPAAIRRAR